MIMLARIEEVLALDSTGTAVTVRYRVDWGLMNAVVIVVEALETVLVDAAIAALANELDGASPRPLLAVLQQSN